MYENSFHEPFSKHSESIGYLHILRRRKQVVLLSLTVALAAAFLFNLFSTPIYEAVATIVCEAPKGNILIAEAGRPPFNSSDIIYLIEQLKSRTLAEELARTLPKQIIQTLKDSASPGTNISEQDFVIRKLQKNVDAEIVPNSDILKIKVTANNPAVAKIIANTYVERLIAWNLRKKQEEISGVRGVVEKQLAVFQNELNTAEEALRAFKEQNRMISLNEASAELLRRMTDAEVAYNKVKSEREALEQRRYYIEQKKRQLAPSYVEPSNPLMQYPKQRLMSLEMQYSSLQLKGHAKNQPEMLVIKQKINQVKEEVRQQLLNTAQQENLIDPLSQFRHLLQESIGLEVDLETYKAREHGLKNIIVGYDEDMQVLPEQELEMGRLIREREVNEKIYSMLLQKREEVRIAEAGKVGDVKLIDAAQVPMAPIMPKKQKNLALGFFLGLGIGVAMAFLIESLDTTLKSQEDVEKYVDLPVLTSIPTITPNGGMHSTKRNGYLERSYSGRLLSQLEAGSHVYEAYRSLQIKFALTGSDGVLKSILVTSPSAADGKTLTAINIAQAYARSNIKTLLVDCDLRRPMIHRILGIHEGPGLGDALRNRIVLIEKVASRWAVQMRDNENLFVFPCGTLPPNAYELLNTPKMRQLLAEFERQYDLVILDSPPLMAATDSILLGNEVDGVCLVLKSGISQAVALRAKQLLENSRTNILGTILNDVDVKNVNGYYKSAYYIS